MPIVCDDEPALVIHSRPYLERNLLLELYTLNYGRISAVARLGKKKSNGGMYLPYTPLRLSLHQGRSQLVNITSVYMQRPSFQIQIPRFFSACYINELMYLLVKTRESDPGLFAAYIKALEGLESGDAENLVLREFESALITSLGYGLSFCDSDGNELKESCLYFFVPATGFCEDKSNTQISYRGSDLLALKDHDYSNTNTLIILKDIHKQILNTLLDGRELKSRSLYRDFLSNTQSK
ncbi:MAG: DNA repair protein RecO [Succinivibrio sp.]